MVYIPNLLFSKQLFKYSELWGLDSERINGDVARVSDDFLGFDEEGQVDKRFLPYSQELIDGTIDGTTMRLIEKMIDERIREIVRGNFRGNDGEQTTSGIQNKCI
uniref:Uncharacterized protein n=1 Tax=Glossina austeni TaxID=7395 RepID=A0A1A9VPQ6_GLOAU